MIETFKRVQRECEQCNVVTQASLRSILNLADVILMDSCLSFEQQTEALDYIFEFLCSRASRVVKMSLEATNISKPMLTIIATFPSEGHLLSVNHIVYWDNVSNQWTYLNTGKITVYASNTAKSRVAGAVLLRP